MDELHWNAYPFYKQVKHEIYLAEREYVCSELKSSKVNTNSIWKVINHCTSKKNAPIATCEDPMAQANVKKQKSNFCLLPLSHFCNEVKLFEQMFLVVFLREKGAKSELDFAFRVCCKHGSKSVYC